MEGDNAFAEGEKNSTIHAMSESPDAADTTRASENDATFVHESSSRTHITRPSGRMRSLRPILILPSFPSSRLLPIMSIPKISFSSDQNDTEEDPSFSTTTITVKGLHPNTVKADIRPVFQRFGEVTRILIEPDGKRAAVVFANVHGVKNTLHSYAEKPLYVLGREVTVFRKHTKTNKVSGMDGDWDAPSRATRTEHVPGDGVIFVSNFPRMTTVEELSKGVEPFGKYEKFVMRMCFFLSTRQVGFLSGLIVLS